MYNGKVTAFEAQFRAQSDFIWYRTIISVDEGASTVTVAIPANVIVGGNRQAQRTFGVDVEGPAIGLAVAVGEDAVVSDDFTVTITFSEAVLEDPGQHESIDDERLQWDAGSDITITNGGLVRSYTLGNSGKRFQAVVHPKDDYEGVLTFTIRAGAVDDEAGNLNATAEFTRRMDTKKPSVTDIDIASTPADPNGYGYAAGETITLGVRFHEPVTVAGESLPSFVIKVGDEIRRAGYVSGTGTDTLSFSYTVQAADLDADGISYAADSIELNGATIGDAVSNTASLSHDAMDDAPAHQVTTAPEVRVEADASAPEGDRVEFTVSLSAASSKTVRVRVEALVETGDTAEIADFVAASARLTFPAGETSKPVLVVTVDDATDEADETFTLRLSNATAATLPADPTATGTILDNDGEPSVRFADASASEGETVAFTVELLPASGKTVTADWAVSLETGDTAQADDFDDFPPTGTVTFNPGHNTAELIVESVIDDTLDEDDEETFTLTLSNPTNATLAGNASRTMTLRDDDDPPTLRVAAASASEGHEMAFAVTLSAASNRTVTVDVATSVASDDTAEAGTDFTAVMTRLTFTAGQTQKIVTVLTADDTLEEDNETFTLTLSNPVNATLQDGGTMLSRTGTINDDDDATLPEVRVEDASAPEGKDVEFTVSLSAKSERAVTVDMATSVERDDTAEAGTDFTAVATTLTFAPDEIEKRVLVATTEDSTDEDDETFTLTLWNAMNAALARDRTATGTIIDDGATLPEVRVAAASATEGKAVAFTVRLSAASGKPVTVAWAAAALDEAGDSAGVDDFTADSGRLIIDAGKTTGTVRVATTDDTLDEDDETFTLTLLNPSNATLATDRTATGRIEDDDAEPTLSVVTAASADEGEAVAFEVTLSAASGRQVTVDWAVSLEGNTAEIADFTADSGTLTIDVGDTTGTVSVVPTDDTTDEDDETFTLTLLNPSNATLAADRTAAGTIYDNDGSPMLRVEGATATEGNDMEFTVELTAASVRAVTVDWETSVASDDTAEAGTDFTVVAATTLTFTPNETEKRVTVDTAEDTLNEYRETFTLTLSSARNATLETDPTATGTIDDDDEAPVLSVETASATEGSDVKFTVTLSAASGKPVTVAWAAAALDEAGDSAGVDDFTADSGTLTFAAGDTQKTVPVKTAHDDLDEDDETFTLRLSSPTNATLPAVEATATGTIDDDDVPVVEVSFAQASYTVAEGSTVTVTVALSAAPERTVEVPLRVANQGDTTAADYAGVPASVTFASDDTEQTFTITAASDDVDDDNDSVVLSFGTLPAGVDRRERPATSDGDDQRRRRAGGGGQLRAGVLHGGGGQYGDGDRGVVGGARADGGGAAERGEPGRHDGCGLRRGARQRHLRQRRHRADLHDHRGERRRGRRQRQRGALLRDAAGGGGPAGTTGYKRR